jgi:hypothetical protein
MIGKCSRVVTRYEIDIPPASLNATLGMTLPNSASAAAQINGLNQTSGGGMDSILKADKFLKLTPKRTGAA